MHVHLHVCMCQWYDKHAWMRMDPSPSVSSSMYNHVCVLCTCLHHHASISPTLHGIWIQLVQPVHVATLIVQWSRLSEILARQLSWPRQGSACWDRRPDAIVCDAHVRYVHVLSCVYVCVQDCSMCFKVYISSNEGRRLQKAYGRIGGF